jgi:PleD family two-component response regulator
MRSYDLLVRLGGHEFLCVLPKITLAEARARFDRLRAELKNSAGASVSVGFSELRDGDSPGEFIRRADTDLLARRSA